jgi:AraC-like DNA-binding protein
MQQQNVNLGSLPSQNIGTAKYPSKSTIAIADMPNRQEIMGKAHPVQAKTHEVLTKVIGNHRIDAITDHQFQTHHLSTGNFDLVDIQWQGAFQLNQDRLDTRYVIYLVLSGSLSQKINQYQAYACSPATATIVNPDQKLESIASQEGKALLMSIDRDSIDSAVGKILDRSLKQPVMFLNSIDLTHELGLSLKKFIQFLWESAAASNLADFSLLMLKKLEKAFVSCLIEGLPSNYAEEILYQHDGAFACHVRKAHAFIESHLHEDIKLGDIATAAGVSSRLLQKAFSLHCGCPPMRFVAQERLQGIRQELERRSTTDTKIVDVMMDYGLTQGGKFAKEYQQLFGEKPSDTLKRPSQLEPPQPPLWQQIDDALADRITGGRSVMSPNLKLAPAAGLPPKQVSGWAAWGDLHHRLQPQMA